MPSTSSTPVWRENLPLKIVNVLAYLFFLSSNAYSSLSPSSYSTGGRYSSAGSMETYVTPSPWIFLVWPLIHTLLLGMVILQFFPSGHSIVSNVVGWRFPILSVLTSVYAGLNTASARYDHHHHNGGGGHHGGGDGIHLRSRVYAICAFIALLLSAGVVSHIYRDLQVHSSSSSSSSALPTSSNSSSTTRQQRTTWLQLLFIHTPYSLYHGFLVVLLVVSGFAAFGTNAETHAHAGIISKILVFLALLFLEATAAGYVVSSLSANRLPLNGSISSKLTHTTSLSPLSLYPSPAPPVLRQGRHRRRARHLALAPRHLPAPAHRPLHPLVRPRLLPHLAPRRRARHHRLLPGQPQRPRQARRERGRARAARRLSARVGLSRIIIFQQQTRPAR